MLFKNGVCGDPTGRHNSNIFPSLRCHLLSKLESEAHTTPTSTYQNENRSTSLNDVMLLVFQK